MIGKRFGKLTVVEISNSISKEKRKIWKCKCDCGNIREVATKYLNNGTITACKECSRKNSINIKEEKGKQYNDWIILDFYRDKKNKLIAVCKCKCGTIKDVIFANIKNGSSKNCGCGRKKYLSNKAKGESIIGKKFGKLLVLEEKGKDKNRKIKYKCVCECGNKVTVLGSSLKNGHTSSCGCSQSKYPALIKNIIEEFGYKVLLEKTIFIDNESIDYIRFDLYIEELNLAIEYDGEPHFKPVDWAGKGIEWAINNLERTQLRDEIKNKYCYDNDIYLLRIPYTQKDNFKEILIETIKIIADND